MIDGRYTDDEWQTIVVDAVGGDPWQFAKCSSSQRNDIYLANLPHCGCQTRPDFRTSGSMLERRPKRSLAWSISWDPWAWYLGFRGSTRSLWPWRSSCNDLHKARCIGTDARRDRPHPPPVRDRQDCWHVFYAGVCAVPAPPSYLGHHDR
jgi:hypothetical protein